MARILLTGGTGFIGKNLLYSEALSTYEIVAPTRKELNLMDNSDVRNFFLHEQFDIVVHSAIKPAHRAATDLSSIMLDNSRMFFNLIQNKKSFTKFIHLGSGAGYDVHYYHNKMAETEFGSSIPIDELGLYKFMVGKFAESNPWLIDLRIFGIYGPYEDYSIRFISNMICKALFDLPLTVHQDRLFDYLWVQDLAPIIAHFIEHKSIHQAYNITPDNSCSLVELAKLILSKMGKKLPIIVDKPGYGAPYSGDNYRLKKELKLFQFTSLDEGISSLIDWYSERISLIDKDKLLTDK